MLGEGSSDYSGRADFYAFMGCFGQLYELWLLTVLDTATKSGVFGGFSCCWCMRGETAPRRLTSCVSRII